MHDAGLYARAAHWKTTVKAEDNHVRGITLEPGSLSTMNIETNDHVARDRNEALMEDIAVAVGDIGGVNIDDNCTIGCMDELLSEIESAFNGDLAGALEAVRSGKLQFEDVHYPDGDYWAWHIKATRQ